MSTSAATGRQPAVERSFDHEVTLGEEHPGTCVVALVGPARQAPFVEPELSKARIVRIVDLDDVHQKWYG